MEREHERSGEGLQVLVFGVGEEEYCVEVEKVRSVIDLIDITRMPRAPKFVKGIINLRGQIVAVLDLAERLKLPPCKPGPKPRIAVIESGDVVVGVVVDSPEVLSLTVEEIEPPPELLMREGDFNIIKGVAKTEDRLFVMLDTERLLTAEEWEDLGEMAGTEGG